MFGLYIKMGSCDSHIFLGVGADGRIGIVEGDLRLTAFSEGCLSRSVQLDRLSNRPLFSCLDNLDWLVLSVVNLYGLHRGLSD